MEKDFFVATGTPPRNKNFILPLVGGEVAWETVKTYMEQARSSIHMCFWALESDHELVRKDTDIFTNPEKREPNCLLSVLGRLRRAGVKIRILLWNWKLTALKNPWLDSRIFLCGNSGVFEVIYQPHPAHFANLGSWHQKTIIIDDDTAFVGGMNAKANDWDTVAHTLYDYRRTPYDTSGQDRLTYQRNKKVPKYPCRQDYIALVKGELVADVQANFAERWNFCIDNGYAFSNKATRIPPASSKGQGLSDVKAQVSRTIPAYGPRPMGERGILETYKKAIALAEDYIYIEDQYFRSQVIAEELARACLKNRKLRLIVATEPDYISHLEFGESWKVASPLTTKWTAKAFRKIQAVVPNFQLHFLQVSDLDRDGNMIFEPMDLHSKIMIIDDEWYTVGSCNLNDRGFDYEGELNIAVHHPKAAGDFRKAVFGTHLKTACPDNINDAIKLWYEHAERNYKAWANKTAPVSLVYPFTQAGPMFILPPNDWF